MNWNISRGSKEWYITWYIIYYIIQCGIDIMTHNPIRWVGNIFWAGLSIVILFWLVKTFK